MFENLKHRYNYLNLPYQIIGAENDTLYMLYDAEGGLLQRKYSKAGQLVSKIDYLDGVEVVNNVIESVYHEDGRIRKEGPTWQYDYYLTDHLENVRSVFSDDNADGIISTNEIKQRNDYYAFGMAMKGSTLGSQNSAKKNRYLYNGKELVEEMNLGLHMYGARMHDAVLGRFTTIDPLVTKYSSLRPYNYVDNNPIKYIDPTGRSINGEFEKKKDGTWEKTSTKGDDIGVDFYHFDATDTEPQKTYVTDRQGNWNIINNGRIALKGDLRSLNVNYKTITDEFLEGTRPERSYFEGDHPANLEIQNHYLFRKEVTLFGLGSYGFKYRASISWSPIDVVKTRSKNMQAQMMGSYIANFYKLGDKTLSLVQDSKSRYSLFYHLPLQNYTRSEGVPVTAYPAGGASGFEAARTKANTNTYQTYLFFDE